MSETVLDYNGISNSCDKLKNLSERIKEESELLNQTIEKLPNEWEGDAGDNSFDELKKFAKNLPEAQKTIAMSVLFLAGCADGYASLDDKAYKDLIELAGGQDAIDAVNVDSLPDVDLSARVKSQFAAPDDGTVPTSEKSGDYSGGTSSDSGYSGGYSGGNSGYYGSGASSVSYPSVPIVTPSDSVNPGDSKLLEQFKVEIPDGVEQGGYTVTGYDKWIDSGDEMVWDKGTTQNTISELWKKQGSRFKNGIAVVTIDGEERYLVALTTKFGNPGDLVDIELENGKIIKAVIADSKGDGSGSGSEYGHLLDDGSVNVIEFEAQRDMVIKNGNPGSKNWKVEWQDEAGSVPDVKTITNRGTVADANGNIIGKLDNNNNVVSARGSSGAAVDWAEKVAADPNAGYSQENREGPDYDCSSLVLNAYKNAGVDVGGASYTGDMKSCLTGTGNFEWIEGDPYTNGANLQPGDILLKNGHTEMYYGDGKTVGAHENADGVSGDSSGNEINIRDDIYKGKWAGYFRYIPKTKIV